MKNDVDTKRSHFDELLALRPKDDAPAQALQEALDAIKAKAQAFAMQADYIGGQRSKALLNLPGSQILAMDQEIALLKIAVEQANVLVAQLEPKLLERQSHENCEYRNAQIDRLHADNVEFAERFHPFYKNFIAQYLKFMAEYEALRNRGFAIHGHVAQLTFASISPAYYEKTCLPMPDLPARHRFRTPMSHHGKFWVLPAAGEPYADNEFARVYIEK